MDSKEKILGHIEFLIKKGAECKNKNSQEKIFAWSTQTLEFISNLLGRDSIYVERFEYLLKIYDDNEEDHVKLGIPILMSIKEDIRSGALEKIQALVAAEVFTDFLDMSSHLLENGYKDAATSLIGAVLEDGLRQIAKSAEVNLKTDENISSLNQKLVEANVYNQIKRKQVQVWNDIRNHADHGKFDEYKIDDVKEMLRGVTQFLSDYLH